MTYTEVIQYLGNSILNSFEQVYHSAETIINDKGIKQPAVSLNNEYVSIAPTDQRETIYIRRNGDDTVIDEMKIGSCTKSYRMQTPLRIVYFQDHAKNHKQILSKLMQSVLIQGTKLRSVIQDKWKLKKDESSGDYKFGPKTAYFAIDIFAIWVLSPDTCEDDFCIELDNPFKKCTIVETVFCCAPEVSTVTVQ